MSGHTTRPVSYTHLDVYKRQGNMSEIVIREAVLSDAEELLAIYAPYVQETVITFEYEAPTLSEFRKRMTDILGKYPYLAAEQNGEIVGYAYAAPFKERAAYG